MPVATEEEYDTIRARFGDLLTQRRRTAAEERLMDLLGILIEDYDRRHALPPDDATPGDRLRFLLDHSVRKQADLTPIFGQRSHVNEALTGRRAISAPQARELGKLFRVNPGLFL